MRRLEVAAAPDAVAQPARPFVRGMRPEQEDKRGATEQDQGRELILQRHSHVGDQDDRHEEDAVHGAVMAEDVVGAHLSGSPGDDADNQAIVAVLVGRQLMAPGEIEISLGHRIGGGLEPPDEAGMSVRNLRPDTLDQDEGADGGPKQVGQPRRHLESRAQIAPQRGRKGGPDYEAAQAVAAQDPACVGDRPGHRAGQDQHQEHARPAFVGAHPLDNPANDARLIAVPLYATQPQLLSGALRHRSCCHSRHCLSEIGAAASGLFMPAPSPGCRRREPRRP